MKDRKFLVTSTLAVAAIAAAAWLFAQNRELRKEVASLRAKRMTAEIRRPKMKVPRRSPVSTSIVRSERIVPAPEPKVPNTESKPISESEIEEAVKARLAAQRQQAEEARERRRETIAAMTPEQKESQKEAFLEKMRERSQRRLRVFVEKTGLTKDQTSSFEGTVAALDATLRDTANEWAEQIRKTGTFSRDAQVKFVGDISTVLSAGYGEMDATLPESWRTEDGNVNLMEIIGPEALSAMVEALTEAGLEDGLRTIGQVMGGPEGGPDGGPEGGPEGEIGNSDRPDGINGIESPGVGGGPGSVGNPGGITAGPGGMGGSRGGFAPPTR